jgi:hypothetical protein
VRTRDCYPVTRVLPVRESMTNKIHTMSEGLEIGMWFMNSDGSTVTVRNGN